jgi:lysozyme family protein
MATVDFERALEFTLRWEGGYVNHPSDPGGATNRGITQVTYDQWRTQKRLPTREVRLIEEHEVRSIYWQYYWAPVEGRTDPRWDTDLLLFLLNLR